MSRQKAKSTDSLGSRLRVFLLQNFAPVWRLVDRVPCLSRRLNAFLINAACSNVPFRPHPTSTLSDYTSWRSLTDKSYLAMALAAKAPPADLPPVEAATQLFMIRDKQRDCPKSTLLFPIFAQYLTDGFLRTDPYDRRRTTSNHDIDMSPLYGRIEAQTRVLRLLSAEPGRKGRLKSQTIEGEEFPPYLFKAGGGGYDPQFVDAAGKLILDEPLGVKDPWVEDGEAARRLLFAVGGDRVNSTATTSMLNTLFLREHNRLAGVIERENPSWDDDRVFETARNIVIVIFIKIVVEEYINHISSICFPLKADPSVAWEAKWNKPNWMSVEFSLLYRWHSLIPAEMTWNDKTINSAEILLDNGSLVSAGLARAFKWAGQTKAAQLGLHNTAIYLEKNLVVESRAIAQNRERHLQGYNAYRQFMGMKPVSDFDEVTGDPAVQKELRDLYGTPDRVDFYVGLFAEDPGLNSPMPPLLGGMVALDAFTQALNNPLLSKQVFNEKTFTATGMKTIEATKTLWDILSRNLGAKTVPGLSASDVHMTRADWKRHFVAL